MFGIISPPRDLPLSIIIIITSCDTRALHGSPVLSIRLEAHHKAQSSENFLTFLVKNLKSCIFYLLANPAETAYLIFPTTYGFSNCGKDKW